MKNNKFIIGRKLGMTEIFSAQGDVVPVTVLRAGPCQVFERLTCSKNGYSAIQVGFDSQILSRLNKPQKGRLTKSGLEPFKFFKEFRVSENSSDFEVGAYIKCDIFKSGDNVDVSSFTIGRGFCGAIKRWNHHRGPMSHGSKNHRLMGSIGAGTSPGRVFKGTDMPGRKGNDLCTIKNLKIISVDDEKDLILVKGSVPGKKNGLVYLSSYNRGAS